jgi:alpha-1,6-mannosyltransferase
VIVLHDPFWRPAGVADEARRLGAVLVAAHHATPALNAAGVPGPSHIYERFFRRIYHHAYEHVDAVMSVVDTVADGGREATIPLRFGIHPAFVPAPALRRGRVMYAGRLAWEKGVFCLLEAAALSNDPWPLLLVGDGPAKRQIKARIEKLRIEDRVAFRDFEPDRAKLATLYRESSCVVQPGPHETFGLVALEAAASGARVVTCDGTPAARVVGGFAETFRPEEPGSLLGAIERARSVPGDAAAARGLAEALTWESVFVSELADLRRLL